MEKMIKVSLAMLVLTLSIFMAAGTANAGYAGACGVPNGCTGVVAGSAWCFECGDVVTSDCKLSGSMTCPGTNCVHGDDSPCPTRHGLVIGLLSSGGDTNLNGKLDIDGGGYTLNGTGVADRNCEVLTYVEDDCGGGVNDDERIWCTGHPCRTATDPQPAGNNCCLESGIFNGRACPTTLDGVPVAGGLLGGCNATAPACQGGCDDVVVKNLKITGWCDGIFVSGDCEPTERRLTGIVIEGNCIYDNGNDDCGNYTEATCEDGGNWGTACNLGTGQTCPANGSRFFNDAIFTAQVGLDNSNTPGFIGTEGAPGIGQEYLIGDLEFPDLNRDGDALEGARNFIWHNKIYGQKGCACVSCAGGNGVNLQGGLEIDDVIWCGGNEIEKNVIKNCSVSGIHFTHATTYNRIHGNYLLGNGLGGIANGCGWCSGSYIYDNVAKGNYGVGIAVGAMSKIKNNIVTDTQPVENAEFKELGYGDLPGDGIMTVEPCHPLAAPAGICVAGTGTELLGNTSVGNARLDILDSCGPLAPAYGDENMCQTASGNYTDNIPAPNSPCRYASGARLNCRGDINYDCSVNMNDFLILNNEWFSGVCCPCGPDPE